MKIRSKFTSAVIVLSSIVLSCQEEAPFSIPNPPEEIDLTNSIFFHIDLTDRSEDTFKVRMYVNNLTDANALIQFAATTPGTYDIHDIGRFIVDIKAYDEKDNKLGITKTGTNQWLLDDPKNTRVIIYEVKETFDTPVTEHSIYKMAGTSLEKSHALLNNFDILCYPTGLKEHDFYLDIDYPSSWSIGTSLLKDEHGYYYATDYDKFVDNPILLGFITNSSVTVGGAEVRVFSYSKGNFIQASQVLTDINVILEDANEFLETLPVDRYSFIYLFDEFNAGALEHSYSSVYVLRDQPYTTSFGTSIRNISAHEFFHIVTPLNIHSEIIEDFNFAVPTPSEHLWLYEGVTEWAAHTMQFRSSNHTISMATYLNRLAFKKANADFYNTNNGGPMSLSQMSLTCYENGAQQFGNVYQKGALVAALLDIRLLELSNGTTGLREVVLELIETYGPENAFSEDNFFADIAELTGYPTEVTDFLNKYIKGTDALPVESYFDKLGIDYNPTANTFTVLQQPDITPQQEALRTAWSTNL